MSAKVQASFELDKELFIRMLLSCDECMDIGWLPISRFPRNHLLNNRPTSSNIGMVFKCPHCNNFFDRPLP